MRPRLSLHFLTISILTIAAFALLSWGIRAKYLAAHAPIVISTGSSAGVYYERSNEYKAKFKDAHNSINVDVCESDGSPSNLKRLSGKETSAGCPANAAFIQGGIREQFLLKQKNQFNEEQARNLAGLLSMGRILTEPVWVFYNCELGNKAGKAPGNLAELFAHMKANRPNSPVRFLVGKDDSGTNYLATELLEAHGIRDGAGAKFVKDDMKDIANRLLGKADAKDGPADAAFQVMAASADPAKKSAVAKLVETGGICLLSMNNADALTLRYPYLHKVTLPAGAFSLEKPLPPSDVTLVATRAAFVVRGDLDPAQQNALAHVIQEYQRSPAANAKLFPIPSASLAADDPEFPLSAEARRVYRSERTFFQRFLPFWLAVVADGVILYVLTFSFLGLAVQFARVIPTGYNLIISRRRDRIHRELNRLDSRAGQLASSGEVEGAEEDLSRITKQVRRMPLPEAERFALRRHIELVRNHIEAVRKNGADKDNAPP
jgi:TRAP-type uncharacterized transport system substrate-binding protein